MSRHRNHQRRVLELKKDPIKMERKLKSSRESYWKHRKKRLVCQKRVNAEMVKIAKELGNCTRCFKSKENPKYLHCFKCRKYTREYYRKHKEKRTMVNSKSVNGLNAKGLNHNQSKGGKYK